MPRLGDERLNSRRLHIGGTVRTEGREVLNVLPGPHVDHVCDAGDLSRFPDGCFACLYASHVLEHFDFTASLPAALAEWRRVLCPGGRIYVSVPDLEVLARLFLLKGRLSLDERFFVMKMMFGGHVDDHDYHLVGLDESLLGRYLQRAGFVNMRRVEDFGLFDDTSRMVYAGKAISLNMTAEAPGEGAEAAVAPAPPQIARNQPCYCGSGRKFKHCHGRRP
jgi:predicted SAM-dependent methyltransferase